jgi:putative acetyltransferase
VASAAQAALLSPVPKNHPVVVHAAESGVSTVRLSVWKWRVGTIALHERLEFTVTTSWDERSQLV